MNLLFCLSYILLTQFTKGAPVEENSQNVAPAVFDHPSIFDADGPGIWGGPLSPYDALATSDLFRLDSEDPFADLKIYEELESTLLDDPIPSSDSSVVKKEALHDYPGYRKSDFKSSAPVFLGPSMDKMIHLHQVNPLFLGLGGSSSNNLLDLHVPLPDVLPQYATGHQLAVHEADHGKDDPEGDDDFLGEETNLAEETNDGRKKDSDSEYDPDNDSDYHEQLPKRKKSRRTIKTRSPYPEVRKEHAKQMADRRFTQTVIYDRLSSHFPRTDFQNRADILDKVIEVICKKEKIPFPELQQFETSSEESDYESAKHRISDKANKHTRRRRKDVTERIRALIRIFISFPGERGEMYNQALPRTSHPKMPAVPVLRAAMDYLDDLNE